MTSTAELMSKYGIEKIGAVRYTVPGRCIGSLAFVLNWAGATAEETARADAKRAPSMVDDGYLVSGQLAPRTSGVYDGSGARADETDAELRARCESFVTSFRGVPFPSLPTIPSFTEAFARIDDAFGRGSVIGLAAKSAYATVAAPPHPSGAHLGKWRRYAGHWCEIVRADHCDGKTTLWGRDRTGKVWEAAEVEWRAPYASDEWELLGVKCERLAALAMVHAPRDGFGRASGATYDLFARGVATAVERCADYATTEVVSYALAYIDPPRAQATRPDVSKASSRAGNGPRSVAACLGRTGRYQ